MAAPAEVQYARTRDGIDIAYTVVGEGPDLLVAPGFVTHLDLMWDMPQFQSLLTFRRNFRLIVFDKRGTGLSDRSMGFGSLEDRAEDIRAVLEAVESEQTILYGISEGGPMCAYRAATRPTETRALILHGTAACFDADSGFEAKLPDETLVDSAAFIEWLGERWGKGEAYGMFLQGAPDPAAAVRVLARYERSACTPQMCREIMQRNLEIDVRPILPTISAPTLVVHCERDPLISVENGRELARLIPGAKFESVDGDFHGSWLREDMEKVGRPIAAFLLDLFGTSASAAESVTSREVASVLFTDIVASTERAAKVGDASWKALLDQHYRIAARAIDDAGGRLINTTGDGLVATFSGPSQGVGAARLMQDAILSLGVGLRAGLHTGEIERRGDDIGGMGVHVAARISALADAGEILVSRTARDLALGSQLRFEDRGVHELKGVPEPWQLFAVC